MPIDLDRAAKLADAAQKIDGLVDAARTVASLRARTRKVLARAAKVGPVRRFCWTRLAEKADRLAVARGLREVQAPL